MTSVEVCVRCTQVPALTGLRALAALMVFFVHVGPLFERTSWAAEQDLLGRVGASGVTLFFVLSGYLLGHPSTLDPGLRSYLARRFWRIVPTYWVAVIGTVALLAVQHRMGSPASENLALGPVGLNVLLLQAWSPRGMAASIVYPTWSLSVEVAFYALLPLVVPAVRSGFGRWRGGTIALLVGLNLVCGLVVGAGVLPIPTLPLVHLPTFALGVCVACWCARYPRRRAGAVWLAWGGVLGALGVAYGAGVVDRGLPAFALTALPMAALVGAYGTAPRQRLFGRPAVVACGRWSYAFFLVHAVVISAVGNLTVKRPDSLVVAIPLLLLDLGISLLVAAVLYRQIERRFATGLRSRAQRDNAPDVSRPARRAAGERDDVRVSRSRPWLVGRQREPSTAQRGSTRHDPFDDVRVTGRAALHGSQLLCFGSVLDALERACSWVTANT